MLCGPRTDKEDEAKVAALGGRGRLNRAFDMMGVHYEDHASGSIGAPCASAVLAVPAARAPSDGGRRNSRTLSRRKASETDDVQIGRHLVKPGKKSREFSFDGNIPTVDVGDGGQVWVTPPFPVSSECYS